MNILLADPELKHPPVRSLSDDAPDVREVIITYKTHLDVGYTNYAQAVLEQYLNTFIPQTIALCSKLLKEGEETLFVWTTGSWLIHRALETYKGRELKELEEAISAGVIAWHGLPFTTHSELMDPTLFRHGLGISRTLDKRFGKTTIAAKMTDVPGHTRAIVPLLADAGISMLHLGVNPASCSPDVPTAFLWQEDISKVCVVYDHGDYGGTIVLPYMQTGLHVSHTGDNLGPPTIEAIRETVEGLKKKYPLANVRAGRLDDYAIELGKHSSSLPVITSEIGDSWIHGVGTDPGKVSRFKELQRISAQWDYHTNNEIINSKLNAFRDSLLMVPEHTWGMDEKTFLNDFVNYSPQELADMRTTESCKSFEASWKEQRQYIATAVERLNGTPFYLEAQIALNALVPTYPDTTGFQNISETESVFETRFFSLMFDSETGSIIHLINKTSGQTWSSSKNPIGSYFYEVFSEREYERFCSQYIRNWPDCLDWAKKDFAKPGIEALGISHSVFVPNLESLWMREESDGSTRFITVLRMPQDSFQSFGAPKVLTNEIIFSNDSPSIDFVFQWFDKQACRIPEASWLSFNPSSCGPKAWQMRKLGVFLSPLDVVENGNRNLHAVEEIVNKSSHGNLSLSSLDAPLMAPGRPALLNFNNDLPELESGIHFNLHNNVWGTNFPMWYEDNARFRFRLTLGE